MKEIPNPLHAINFITDGFTSRIVNKILGMHPLEKLNSLFPNKKSIKKSHQLKKLKKILNKTTPAVTDKSEIKKSRPLEAYIARDMNEVKEAQALRYKVFAEELGARLPFNSENLDIDEFDQYCDHLIVRDQDSLMVIGTYRILPPDQAKLIGKVYSANEFDLSRIEHLLPKAVEVGRSCVHPNYRSGAVIMALWSGLAEYMLKNNYEIMLGCASIPMSDGGHFAASLGVVELSVALHYIYNTPYDQLVWDVGHQAYGHKILTGRRDQFVTNRKYKGLSGFPKRSESEYDTFGVGHSSTSISAALGMAMAAKYKGENRKSIAVIGDGSLTAGMAFEAMNHAGVADSDVLIILNDNCMSIDPNVGALKEYLTDIATSPTYNKVRDEIWNLLGKMPVGKSTSRSLASKLEASVKGMVSKSSNLFEALQLRYFGKAFDT